MEQNADMRKISAWVAIAAMPTMIAGIYGMNFDNMPELHWHYGYFIVLTVMVTVCTGLYRTFRRNHWL
jgi:magnesium transporter